MEWNEINELSKRATYFYKEKKKVHLQRNDMLFFNGVLLDVSEGEFLILDDRMVGEMVIFFTEIIKIEEFKDGRE